MTPLLEIDDLRVRYHVRHGALRRRAALSAVDGVTVHINAGETVALVGESGSGKSTTGLAALRLIDVAGGSIVFDGHDLRALGSRGLRKFRRQAQMVFQDPYASLDPSMVIADSVGEPLEVHLGLRGKERDRRVADLLDRVGMSAAHLYRYPHEFSGGQRQRVAIARAIAIEPRLVVCDEAVSALDVSIQNQIINLLEELQQSVGLAYLFIAHDLSVVRHIAARVAVMYLGKVVEIAPTETLFLAPAHPYTQALLSAVPVPNPRVQRTRQRIVLTGDIPTSTGPPPGCRFHTRCIHAMEVCKVVEPVTRALENGATVACHLYPEATALSDRGGAVVALQPRPPARGASQLIATNPDGPTVTQRVAERGRNGP